MTKTYPMFEDDGRHDLAACLIIKNYGSSSVQTVKTRIDKLERLAKHNSVSVWKEVLELIRNIESEYSESFVHSKTKESVATFSGKLLANHGLEAGDVAYESFKKAKPFIDKESILFARFVIYYLGCQYQRFKPDLLK